MGPSNLKMVVQRNAIRRLAKVVPQPGRDGPWNPPLAYVPSAAGRSASAPFGLEDGVICAAPPAQFVVNGLRLVQRAVMRQRLA